MKTTPLANQHHLFWELHPNSIENALQHSPNWVISRVLHYGTMDDILDLVDFYGKEKLKYAMDHMPLRRKARALAELVYKEYQT